MKLAVVPRKVDCGPVSVLTLTSSSHHNLCIAVKRMKMESSGSSICFPSLRSSPSTTAATLTCVRRQTSKTSPRNVRLFECVTCNLTRVCTDCMHLCHRKHILKERPPLVKSSSIPLPSSYCECALRLASCKLLPTIEEKPDFSFEHVQRASIRIQHMVRKSIARRFIRKSAWLHHRAKVYACITYWEEQVLAPIWRKVAIAVCVLDEKKS